jgi:predicted phosphodiesterase
MSQWLQLNNIFAREYVDFDPMTIGDITIFHGDKGICGAKGSPKSFSKGSGKTIVGHSHAEQIFQGVINPGCLVSLPQGYQAGLSKSTQGIVLVASSGKRSLITADGGFLMPFSN